MYTLAKQGMQISSGCMGNTHIILHDITQENNFDQNIMSYWTYLVQGILWRLDGNVNHNEDVLDWVNLTFILSIANEP